MKNIGNMLKQAQQMQKQMAELQEKLAQDEHTGSAGAGMVEVTLNGKNEMKKLKIDSSLADPEEIEMLEDLVVAAYNDARTKVETAMSEEMGKLTGGLQLPPGMKLPF
ncbi:MAG: YbaB/EbfC family nucleoid-associated protein [Geminicoccaceae bacterium]